MRAFELEFTYKKDTVTAFKRTEGLVHGIKPVVKGCSWTDGLS